MRKEYQMTQADLDKLMQAAKPVPMIALQCCPTNTPWGNVNRAWVELGNRLGFDGMTVHPKGKGNLFFTAEEKCRGIEIEPGAFSGCDSSGGDCPECGK